MKKNVSVIKVLVGRKGFKPFFFDIDATAK